MLKRKMPTFYYDGRLKSDLQNVQCDFQSITSNSKNLMRLLRTFFGECQETKLGNFVRRVDNVLSVKKIRSMRNGAQSHNYRHN